MKQTLIHMKDLFQKLAQLFISKKKTDQAKQINKTQTNIHDFSHPYFSKSIRRIENSLHFHEIKVFSRLHLLGKGLKFSNRI